MPPVDMDAEAPPERVTPATSVMAFSRRWAEAVSSAASGRSLSSRSRSASERPRRAGSARPANGSSGATRAIATPRSASAFGSSVRLAEITAERRPTKTRRPRSADSARSVSSTLPSRTETDSAVPCTTTASASSAPAARAAATRRSATSVSAERSVASVMGILSVKACREGRRAGNTGRPPEGRLPVMYGPSGPGASRADRGPPPGRLGLGKVPAIPGIATRRLMGPKSGGAIVPFIGRGPARPRRRPHQQEMRYDPGPS